MTAVLDHLAIGTPVLTDGWELFGGVLGGTRVYGLDSPGYWWGQREFAAGPKIERARPAGGSGTGVPPSRATAWLSPSADGGSGGVP